MSKSANPKKLNRVFIVDDHALVREALSGALLNEAGLEVCGQAADREEALEAIARVRPDLVLVDLRLRNSDGMEFFRDLLLAYPEILILVVSMQDEQVTAERVVRAGARGYVSKIEPPSKIMEAVHKVLEGGIYLSERAVSNFPASSSDPCAGLGIDAIHQLSSRERQVFEMVGLGRNLQQIAGAMSLDVSTVETYCARIRSKLGLVNGADLLQRAIQWTMNK